VINDRNRYWGVSAWGQFAFTNFPDGRRYAEFLTGFFSPNALTIDELGRLAQERTYYHPGPMEPIPQDMAAYLSQHDCSGRAYGRPGRGLSASQVSSAPRLSTTSFYLDRQGNLSVYRTGLGLIISGANSKTPAGNCHVSRRSCSARCITCGEQPAADGRCSGPVSLAYKQFLL